MHPLSAELHNFVNKLYSYLETTFGVNLLPKPEPIPEPWWNPSRWLDCLDRNWRLVECCLIMLVLIKPLYNVSVKKIREGREHRQLLEQFTANMRKEARAQRRNNQIQNPSAIIPAPFSSVQKECVVCLRSFEELKLAGVPILTTPCGHVFCCPCLVRSMEISRACPSCRKDVEVFNCVQIHL